MSLLSVELQTSVHADIIRWINIVLTLVHRLRRWTSVKTTLIQRLMSAGRYSSSRYVFPAGQQSQPSTRGFPGGQPMVYVCSHGRPVTSVTWWMATQSFHGVAHWRRFSWSLIVCTPYIVSTPWALGSLHESVHARVYTPGHVDLFVLIQTNYFA